MKIALITAGYMSLPPQGHGACEHITYAYYDRLNKLGHQVDIYNTTDLRSVVNSINEIDYDFVHCMYDDYIGILSEYCNKPIWGQTHYGYLTQKDKWSPGYHYIHSGVLKATGGLICISQEIADIYKKDGYSRPIHVLRNGADVKSIRFSETPKFPNTVICLGKIESRKQQTKLAALCEGRCNIDFVGPHADPMFCPGKTCRYLGEWTREMIYDRLTDYSCLILASDGEGAPLVVPEALAAGLTICCTEFCKANLEKVLSKSYIEWIYLDKPEEIPNSIDHVINISQSMRKINREVAEQYFDWNIIIDEYIKIVEKEVGKKDFVDTVTNLVKEKFEKA